MHSTSSSLIALETNQKRNFVNLFHFYIGSTHYYYNNSDQVITYNGNVYSPAPISRRSVTYESTIKSTIMTLNVSKINAVASQVLAIYFPALVFCDVIQISLDQDPYEGFTIFSGIILDISMVGADASIKVASYDYLLNAPIPRWRFQLQCNHALFSSDCGLNAEDYAVSASVTVSGNGRTLTSEIFAGYDDDYFTYGHISYDCHYRRIVSHTGNEITIAIGIYGMTGSISLTAYPGCDSLVETCYSKFNNVAKFMGFPEFPLDNPVLWT